MSPDPTFPGQVQRQRSAPSGHLASLPAEAPPAPARELRPAGAEPSRRLDRARERCRGSLNTFGSRLGPLQPIISIADQRLDSRRSTAPSFRIETLVVSQQVRRLRFTGQRHSLDTNLFSPEAADAALALSISSSAEIIDGAKSGRARPTRASKTITSSSATPTRASTTRPEGLTVKYRFK